MQEDAVDEVDAALVILRRWGLGLMIVNKHWP
jgi:hypothetical protein